MPPCPCILGQFQGETNAGQVTEGRNKTEVILSSTITEKLHGECCCDGIGCVCKAKLGEGVAYGHHLEPGTRNHVLYLAQMHPKPAAGVKKGLWSPKRYFYGFYDVSLLRVTRHFKNYRDSKQYLFRIGLCDDEDKVRREGPLLLRSRASVPARAVRRACGTIRTAR